LVVLKRYTCGSQTLERQFQIVPSIYSWTIKARDARGITAVEMKYMKITAGYTRTDYKTNTQIARELKITQILDKLLEYKRNYFPSHPRYQQYWFDNT
jgi:hypothetical protein